MNLSSEEIEYSVLGAVFQGDEAKADLVLDSLSPQDFTVAPLRRIFESMLYLRPKKSHQDLFMVYEHSGVGDLSLITDCSANFVEVGTEGHLEYLKSLTIRRQLKKKAEDISALAESEKDASRAIQSALEGIASIEAQESGLVARDSSAILRDIALQIDAAFSRKDGEVSGMATGLDDIDKRIDGFKSGDLVVVGARPGMGKTAYMLKIAISNLLKAKRGVIFSVEMTDAQLYLRLISALSGIDIGHVTRGMKNADPDSWKKLEAAYTRIKGFDCAVYEKGHLHIDDLCAVARREFRRQPMDFIAVDHIHIMKGNGETQEREIADITGKLKSLAKELKCPVIALAQLNRSVESRPDKRPMMSDLRGGGAIEQDADIVQFLYRDDYYDEHSDRKGMLDVMTSKFRQGEPGTDCVQINLPTMQINNLIQRDQWSH